VSGAPPSFEGAPPAFVPAVVLALPALPPVSMGKQPMPVAFWLSSHGLSSLQASGSNPNNATLMKASCFTVRSTFRR
jgi:hypothetical protein